jgi:uncharacterized protein YjbI with pentapeptide repeats
VEQQQQSRGRPTRRHLLWTVGIIVALAFLILVICGYLFGWKWTGLPKQTLWDWMKLLIIPAVLAVGGYLFTRSENRATQAAAERRAQDDALQTYLDQMSDMLIPNKDLPSLYKARPGDSLSSVARARTQTTLFRSDGDRKARIVQFLYEAGLLTKGFAVLDLTAADLSGACLGGANLVDSDVHGANLSGARLAGADLRGADLRGADLSGSDLRGADLREANLDGGTCTGVDLSGANVSEANLSGCDLSGADLSEANLSGADLSTVDLSGANLNKADLHNARLVEAQLYKTDLRKASRLHGADLRNAHFRGPTGQGHLDLSGIDLSGTNLEGTDLRYVDLNDATLNAANLNSAVLGGNVAGVGLRGARFVEANLYKASLRHAFLNSADLRGADLRGAYLYGADLSWADLSGADLRGVDLTGAFLRETSLVRANLSGANLRGQYLGKSNLSGANLSYADLSVAHGVTKERLAQQTESLEGTIIPDGTIYPGQYAAREFDPALSFTVSDGWRLPYPETTEQLSVGGPDGGALIFTNPRHVYDPNNPSEPKEVPAPETVDEWASWFQSHPNLDTSKPLPLSVGGAPGKRIDVTANSTSENYPRDYCGEEPCVPLYPTSESMIVSYDGYKERFVILDVGGETVLIDVAPPADKFDEFLPKAQKVLDTLEWEGG